MTSDNNINQDSGTRQKGVTIVKPIVYGNVARYFGKKREEDGHTHQWTVYVKPFRNEDMSSYVKKIHFKLHESYANFNRIITKAPYEVTETGWGEFEVIIKIFFNDPNEKPVSIYHLLKLFQSESDVMNGKKNLVSEFYDEIVFQDPSTMLHQMLCVQKPLAISTSTTASVFQTNFDEKREKSLAMLEDAENQVKQQIQQLNQQLKQTQDEINNFTLQIQQSSQLQ